MVEISIIVPVYNAEIYLRQCLDSLINQTFKNIEILCVDGDSMDGSLKILREYQEQDERVKVYSKANEGVSLGRNFGMDRASGKYLMFVDADDWIDDHTCELAYRVAEKQQADLVMWSYIREFRGNSLPKDIFDKDEKIFEGKEVTDLHRRFWGLIGEELVQVENADALCPVWGKLYRRDIIEDHHIRFTDIRKIGTYEDGLFNLEVFEYLEKVIYMKEYFYHYRKYNTSSITSQYKEHLFEQWNHLYDLMANYINEKELGQDYKTALNNRICLGILGQGLNLMASDRKKMKEIKNILSHKKYRAAYRNFDLRYFPIHWKVFYGFAKYNMAWGVYGMLLCIQRLIGR